MAENKELIEKNITLAEKTIDEKVADIIEKGESKEIKKK